MKNIQIPEGFIQAFEFVAGLHSDQAKMLGDLVSHLPFKMDPDGFANSVYELFPSAEKFDLAQAIYSLGSILNRENVKQHDLVLSLATDFEDKKNKSIQDNLQLILADTDQLKHIYKAYSLQRQAERILTKSSVYTDVRFCFEEDLDNWKADHGVIIHNLKLEFLSSEGKPEEFFIGLDHEDLNNIIESAKRALKKEEAIKKQYSQEISWFN
jgi:hypothetical protein